jgi:hypothetical protein
LTVLRPASASNATFALNSALKTFLCISSPLPHFGSLRCRVPPYLSVLNSGSIISDRNYLQLKGVQTGIICN